MVAMEGTLQTIDRLIEGMNGEDPGGARIYMSQLQENEVGVSPNFKKHQVVYQSIQASYFCIVYPTQTIVYCSVLGFLKSHIIYSVIPYLSGEPATVTYPRLFLIVQFVLNRPLVFCNGIPFGIIQRVWCKSTAPRSAHSWDTILLI